MVVYLEKAIKFQKMPGKITKDAGLILLEEVKRAEFECFDLFHQIMSTFVIIQLSLSLERATLEVFIIYNRNV